MKTYQFYCDNCNYKRITSGTDLQDLVEVKMAAIPRGTPILDSETKKILVPPSIKRRKTFKCPKCGFAITPKQMKENNEKNFTD